jgi:hypothetical protein
MNRFVEGDFDSTARFNVNAGTCHAAADLFTSLPQRVPRKCMCGWIEKLVEKRKSSWRGARISR